MSEEGFKHKLAAILSADVVGYTRLMAEDEVATVRTLSAYRDKIENKGRTKYLKFLFCWLFVEDGLDKTFRIN